MCNDDRLGLKDVFYGFLMIFGHFNFLIKIHKYANKIICILTYLKMKRYCEEALK